MVTIGIRMLNKTYGAHVTTIFSEFLKQLPKERGASRSYEVLKPLPSVEEFIKLRIKKFTLKLSEHLEFARDAVNTVKEELEDWLGNLPEAFAEGEKGQEIQEAIDCLDSVSIPELEDSDCENMDICFIPTEGADSRPDRIADIINLLTTVVSSIPDEGLSSELQEAISELENIQFPSAF